MFVYVSELSDGIVLFDESGKAVTESRVSSAWYHDVHYSPKFVFSKIVILLFVDDNCTLIVINYANDVVR